MITTWPPCSRTWDASKTRTLASYEEMGVPVRDYRRNRVGLVFISEPGKSCCTRDDRRRRSCLSAAPQNSMANVQIIAPGQTRPIPAPTTNSNLADRAGDKCQRQWLAFENIPPDIFLQNVGKAINQYGAQFGGNPVGTNPEITAALNGGNPKQVNFIKPEAGMRINEKGELVDTWGTPAVFPSTFRQRNRGAFGWPG